MKNQKEYLYKRLNGLNVKTYDKETPYTHRRGKLLNFHCNKCNYRIISMYEIDHLEGGGVVSDLRYCSRCGNRVDFGEYYHKEEHLDDDLKLED